MPFLVLKYFGGSLLLYFCAHVAVFFFEVLASVLLFSLRPFCLSPSPSRFEGLSAVEFHEVRCLYSWVNLDTAMRTPVGCCGLVAMITLFVSVKLLLITPFFLWVAPQRKCPRIASMLVKEMLISINLFEKARELKTGSALLPSHIIIKLHPMALQIRSLSVVLL